MEHRFVVKVDWQGNLGVGTASLRSFSRKHELTFPDSIGQLSLPGSAAAPFHGDSDRYNPEQLLAASVAQCHMMTYFWLAVREGVTVLDYQDTATAFLKVNSDGSGQIERIILQPRVLLSPDSDIEKAQELHSQVRNYCFIARSVNFPIEYRAEARNN